MGKYIRVTKSKDDGKVVIHNEDDRHPPTVWHPQSGWACIDTFGVEYVVYPTSAILRCAAEGRIDILERNVDAPEIVLVDERWVWAADAEPEPVDEPEPEEEPEEEEAPKPRGRRKPPSTVAPDPEDDEEA